MTNPLDGAYGILIKLALVVALCSGLYGTYKYRVHQAVTEAVQVVNIQHAAETFKQKEIIFDKAQTEKNKLQEDFDKRQGEKDAKIKTLNADVSSLLNSLRNRPDRPTSNSGVGTSTSTEANPTIGTGAGLYQSDASFLVGQASRAEEIRLGLLQCYNDYDAVKKSVESFSKK